MYNSNLALMAENIGSPDNTINDDSYPQNILQLDVNDLNNINNLNNTGQKLYPQINESKPQVLFGTDNQPVTDRRIEVSWRNLIYTVEKNALLNACRKENKNRTILKGLSGYFRSGNLTAIMGPSGSGKSTLLECVSGFRKKGLTGDVRITGSKRIKIGLIAQNDHLINQLSVKEALLFASKLKNYKRNFGDEELEEVIVDEDYAENQTISSSSYHDMLARHVMKQLGLEVCADTRSGNCSGGQRKRLSIALELISK
jgi:ABC-type multidrug transport system ATPase subunit